MVTSQMLPKLLNGNNIKLMGRPSIRRRSKTWRSPSSLQIHRNTSTCGTTPTEHLLNAGRRPQTSQKARNSPRTWVGEKKKEETNRDKTIGMGPAPVGGSCEGGSFHTLGSPFTGGDRGWRGGSFGATEKSTATGVQRAKRRDSRKEDQCQSALTSLRGSSTHLLGLVGAGS